MAILRTLIMAIKVVFDMVGMGILIFFGSRIEIQDKAILCFNDTHAKKGFLNISPRQEIG